jgi:hypothetical protein
LLVYPLSLFKKKTLKSKAFNSHKATKPQRVQNRNPKKPLTGFKAFLRAFVALCEIRVFGLWHFRLRLSFYRLINQGLINGRLIGRRLIHLGLIRGGLIHLGLIRGGLVHLGLIRWWLLHLRLINGWLILRRLFLLRLLLDGLINLGLINRWLIHSRLLGGILLTH